eukprot:scaffold162922_cov21-Tisochrysis_lutea.AAC.1
MQEAACQAASMPHATPTVVRCGTHAVCRMLRSWAAGLSVHGMPNNTHWLSCAACAVRRKLRNWVLGCWPWCAMQEDSRMSPTMVP